MKDDPEMPQQRADGGPAPWRRWRIERWVLFVVLAACAYGTWREYRFREAIKEAKALGWEWVHDDPIDAIQKDWKAAFRKATWVEGSRELWVNAYRNDVDRHGHVIRWLRPRKLWILHSKTKDLSVVEGLPALEWLKLSNCNELANVDALEGKSTLRDLDLDGCGGLTNVNGLKGLSGLQKLDLSYCTRLTNVDALKGLSALRFLDLSYCSELANVDGLKELSALEKLDLSYCTRLTNLDALKGLSKLIEVSLVRWTAFSAKDVADLRAALPNTNILE